MTETAPRRRNSEKMRETVAEGEAKVIRHFLARHAKPDERGVVLAARARASEAAATGDAMHDEARHALERGLAAEQKGMVMHGAELGVKPRHEAARQLRDRSTAVRS